MRIMRIINNNDDDDDQPDPEESKNLGETVVLCLVG